MERDLIIDCFAGGGGASVGIEMALGRQVDIAIDHDPDAILIHKTNHPRSLHLTEEIFKVDLRKYVKSQHVALMWTCPNCNLVLINKDETGCFCGKHYNYCPDCGQRLKWED